MKKRLLTFMTISVLAISMLSGCGSKPAQNKTTTETTAENKNAESSQAEADKNKEEKKEDSDFFETKNVEETEAESETKSEANDTVQTAADLDTSKELTGLHHVEIKIKSYGTIKMELDADSAPITVTNFIKLAMDKFYDGLTFHRIIDGFMMQGGDPLGNGTGGSKENIKGEFATNGVENNLSHTRGAVSMARASAPNSASSQFFIVQKDSHFLDGQYAVFGYVTEGMEIVDKICKDAEPIDNNGLIAEEKQPIISEVTVID